MLYIPADFTNPVVVLFVSICLLAFGSFIGCLYYRIPHQLFAEWSTTHSPASIPQKPSTNRWRSHCTHCQKTLRWYHLVPILSYLRQRGKCTFCQESIDPMYSILEFGVCFLGLYWLYTTQNWFDFTIYTASSSILLLLAAIDQRHWILPDLLTQLLLWSGLAYQALLAPYQLPNALLQVMGVYILLRIFTHTYQAIRKTEGLGRGDIKLLAALAAWTPAEIWVATLAIASTLAIIIQGLLLCRKKGQRLERRSPFAFGPYIVAAALTTQILL